MIQTSETIKFKIEFVPTYWDKPPAATVQINDIVKFDGEIIKSPTIVEFEHTLMFNQSHQLIIHRYGKDSDQCTVNSDGTLNDQLLLINKICIDETDIQSTIWTQSYNEPEYPIDWAREQQAQGIKLEKRIPAETCLGHNGTWTLNFTSPFYKFLYKCVG